MKYLTYFFIITLWWVPSIFAQEAKLTIIEIIAKDKWAVADGTHKNLPLIIRFRNEFHKNKPDISGHPHLIQVIWPYESDASGMPSENSSKQMEVFENRLVKAVETDGSAVLVAVITKSGTREWVFYSGSVDEFGNRLANMPQEKERYPIEITTEPDPEWSFLYSNILSGMKE